MLHRRSVGPQPQPSGSRLARSLGEAQTADFAQRFEISIVRKDGKTLFHRQRSDEAIDCTPHRATGASTASIKCSSVIERFRVYRFRRVTRGEQSHDITRLAVRSTTLQHLLQNDPTDSEAAALRQGLCDGLISVRTRGA